MIKKIILFSICIHFSYNGNAQFFRGIGIFGSGTMSSHLYKNSLPEDSIRHTVPAPSHRSAERISWGAGLIGEFLKYDRARWQTEFEYYNKGAKENEITSWAPFTRAGKAVNKYSYIQWNNYFKYFFNDGYRGNTYFMIGARIEYNLTRSINAYSAVAGKVRKISASPDAALGYELNVYSKFKPFVELHYNPDVIPLKVGDVMKHRGRTFELRIGIIYRPQKSLDDCNAPRYHGSDY